MNHKRLKILWLGFLCILILMAGCTRHIQVSTNMQMQNPPGKKIGYKVLVVMSKDQAEQVILEKPGALSDNFSFEAGKSISVNLLNMMKAIFKEADFAHEIPAGAAGYDYFILANYKKYNIEWGSTAFSAINMNVYIDYDLLNVKKLKILSVGTDGTSTWRRSGGEAVALINPFVSMGITKSALGDAWDRAVANSLSQWVTQLQGYFKNK